MGGLTFRDGDSAFATVAVEMKWISGWSAAVSFEGRVLQRHRKLSRQGRRVPAARKCPAVWIDPDRRAFSCRRH
ncbi:MAG: hypothetical protein WB420_20950, partial [Bradyrhizobium sp.]